MTGWRDGYWWSSDDVGINYPDYPGRAVRPPSRVIPAVTANPR
jgi:hypothetical protein